MKYKQSSKTSKRKLYDIESIITHKIKGKKKYYLIKWKGYPIIDCSWEPLSHLSNVIDIIKEFEQNYPFSIDHKALKEFKIEYKKYKYKKKSKKNKLQNNKIIIDLCNMNLCSKDEGTKMEEDFIIKKIENKMEKNIFNENVVNENKIVEIIINDSSNFMDNINNDETSKLIKPILIW